MNHHEVVCKTSKPGRKVEMDMKPSPEHGLTDRGNNEHWKHQHEQLSSAQLFHCQSKAAGCWCPDPLGRHLSGKAVDTACFVAVPAPVAAAKLDARPATLTEHTNIHVQVKNLSLSLPVASLHVIP